LPEDTRKDATPCPACAGRLYPKLLTCADCGLEVTTRYASNEFADLEAESLHLLRIFVLCEGRIRDMEAALGVSYPTVKARLAALREKLGLTGETKVPPAPSAPEREPVPSSPATVQGVLDALESGALDYDAAMKKIRELRRVQ
jgi:hypothetical protein